MTALKGFRPRTIHVLGLLAFLGLIPFWLPDAAKSQDYLNDVSRGVGSTPPARSARSGLAIEYDGFTEPKYDILVAASEMGRIESVAVKIGDRVTKGQVVAQLDDQIQRQAVFGAKLRAEMRGELEAAEAEAKLMELRVEQLTSLADKQMARPYELKRAAADWEIAKKGVLAAQEQVQLRKHELARYEEQLRRRRVLAPADGVVADVFHSPGEYVSPSDPTVIRLLVLDQIVAVFNIPVEEISQFAIGKSVTVQVSSLGKGVRGKVETLSPLIDGESGTVEVRILLENENGELRAGDRCQTIGAGLDSATLMRGRRAGNGVARYDRASTGEPR